MASLSFTGAKEDEVSTGWIFDPIPPSGAIRGGIPVSYVFDGNLKTFVREVLQNSHDQKVEDRAEVEFAFVELEAEDLVAFLDALHWPALREHLLGVTERNVLTSRSTAAAIEAIDDLRPLRILKISDYGTHGLTGSEDETGTNYKALVKDVLETTEGGSKKGGSHGLGKAVLWAFSAISTVLFSSSISLDGRSNFRFVGRADLPFHMTPVAPKGFDGSGWLGVGEPLDDPVRAVSIWDDEARHLTGALQLGRQADLGGGTSLLIPCFEEPRVEEQRSLDELADAVVAASIENFWPAINRGTLRVLARVHQPDGTTLDVRASDLSRVRPFVDAVDSPSPQERAAQEGEIAARELEVRFPATFEDTSGATSRMANARLVLRRSSDTDDLPNRDRVALVRGAGMVVEYWKPKRQPLSGGGFHAVLEAGLAYGSTDADEHLEAFLRACEPPAHNKWDAHTNRISNEYRLGSNAAIERLWDDISNAVLDICEAPPPPDQDGPDRLKKMFPIGAGQVATQSFRVTYGSGLFDGTYWTMTARVQRLKGQGSWQTRITALLDGESGTGLQLGIVGGELTIGSAATAEVIDGVYAVVVPSADDVEFTVRAIGRDIGPDLMRRSRARLHTQSRLIGEAAE